MDPRYQDSTEDLLAQRIDMCISTLRKLERAELADPDLTEAATLYSRASIPVLEYYGRKDISKWLRSPFRVRVLNLAELLESYTLRPQSYSPNHTVYALDIQDRCLRSPIRVGSWPTGAVCELIEFHFDNKISLERAPLLRILEAIAHHLLYGGDIKLVVTLAGAVSKLGVDGDRIVLGKLAIALASSAIYENKILDADTSRVDKMVEYYQHHVLSWEMLRSCLAYGLLELLKHSENIEDSYLAGITRVLLELSPRPDEFHLPACGDLSPPGYNARYWKDTIEPSLQRRGLDSEPARAAHFAVINHEFMGSLTIHTLVDVWRLALENLTCATSTGLKRGCSKVLRKACFDFGGQDWFNDRYVYKKYSLEVLESVTSLLPHISKTLETDDDRIVSYMMALVWVITGSVFASDISENERVALLQPVLSHKSFAEARSAHGRPEELLDSVSRLGYVEAWLSRLEKMTGQALEHLWSTSLLDGILEDLRAHTSDVNQLLCDRIEKVSERANEWVRRENTYNSPRWT
ncbi:transmembrane protein [Ceratobasidium sp. AG-Ba]|nr:transmembrane protein [Ceratobasidium sp. AG-Ba]